jgi:hypothetical protein
MRFSGSLGASRTRPALRGTPVRRRTRGTHGRRGIRTVLVRPQAGPWSSSRCPAAFPRGLPLALMRGKQKLGTPKGPGGLEARHQGGPRERAETNALGPGRRPSDTTRKSESGRTARLRRHCGNGLRRYEPMSLSGSGRTRSRPWASRVTVTVLPCAAWRAGVARSTTKRWPSETTAYAGLSAACAQGHRIRSARDPR